MTEPKTHTLDVPGAVLCYDVRGNDSSTEPILLLIGSPMGAAGFVTLAGHFADRTVVTYDPRGVERSVRTDDATESKPDEHADDLHRIITTLDAGPVEDDVCSGIGADSIDAGAEQNLRMFTTGEYEFHALAAPFAQSYARTPASW